MSNYEMICERLSSVTCTDEKLNILKIKYDSVINSKRRLGFIKTVAELIAILKKRDYINPNKVDVLVELASNFEDLPADIIASHGHNLNNNSRINGYTSFQHTPIQDVPVIPRPLGSCNDVLPRLPKNAKERAYKIIATDIGHKWTDFARALHVPEGSIDELDARKNISDSVYEVLRYHEDNSGNSKYWLTELLDALTNARRNDLRKTVQYIFDTLSS